MTRLNRHYMLAAFVWFVVVVGYASAAEPTSVYQVGAYQVGAYQVGAYQVGVARVDITPAYPIRLSGFGGRRNESDGVRQRIWAKALAISAKNEKPAVLFTVDSLGLRMTMVDEVAAELNLKAGVPRSARRADVHALAHDSQDQRRLRQHLQHPDSARPSEAHRSIHTGNRRETQASRSPGDCGHEARNTTSGDRSGYLRTQSTNAGRPCGSRSASAGSKESRWEDSSRLCQLRLPLRHAFRQQDQR